jgi:hypothetical protein
MGAAQAVRLHIQTHREVVISLEFTLWCHLALIRATFTAILAAVVLFLATINKSIVMLSANMVNVTTYLNPSCPPPGGNGMGPLYVIVDGCEESGTCGGT